MNATIFSKNKLVINISLHILIWMALLAIPYLFNSNDIPRFFVVVKRSWVPLGVSAMIFYLNYFILVDKLLFSKPSVFITSNLALIVLAFWLNIYIKNLFPAINNSLLTDAVSLDRQARIRELARYSSVISFVLSVVLCVALKTTWRWVKTETEKEKSEKMRIEAELLHLRYQLQPHFFFNSLNNIYSLIDKSPATAKSALHSLAKLMRYLLYETNDEKMSLDTEIDFLIKYIHLMELRFSENINIKYVFPENGAAYRIAPLLFIPLIENAFKHGIPPVGNAIISFKMDIECDQLIFTSLNRNIPKGAGDESRSGIGLENLRKRLELTYPGQYHFSAIAEGSLYKTVLSINLSPINM